VTHPHPIPLALTYEDYLGFPDDGKRHELLEGEHMMTPAPSSFHQLAVAELLHALKGFLEGRDLGVVLTAPIDVLLSPTDVVQPDLCFVRRDRVEIVTRSGIEGAPDLMVEVLSPTTRQTDETTKLHVYAKRGVAEYWILDIEERTLRSLRWSEDGYRAQDERRFAGGDVVTTPVLPGLRLVLDSLFRDLDRLG
jgi:Uma2 family endonuclease